MKKYFLALFVVALSLCGCSYDKYEVGSELQVYYEDAPANSWHESGREGEPEYYVYQQFRFPEITSSVMDDGAVMVYLCQGNVDVPLPNVFPVADGHITVMENMRFEVEKGLITVVLEWSDFKFHDNLNNYKFKFCILTPSAKTKIY